MKIEKLSINKIKITVSQCDLSDWNMSLENFRPDSPHVREFLKLLIAQAKAETGLNVPGDTVMVEAMPIDNDFVFFVTWLDKGGANQSTKRDLRRRLQNKEYRAIKKPTAVPPVRDDVVCRFDSFDAFADMLKASNDPAKFAACTLYKYDSAYYLVVPAGVEGLLQIAAILSEFGNIVYEKHRASFLGEHGTFIAKDEDFVRILKANGIEQ